MSIRFVKATVTAPNRKAELLTQRLKNEIGLHGNRDKLIVVRMGSRFATVGEIHYFP